MRKRLQTIAILLVGTLLLASCASSRHKRIKGDDSWTPPVSSAPQGWVKDNKPEFWSENHPRVAAFRRHYAGTPTVETALKRAQGYLPHILPEFKKRRLPYQLAFLPMIESMFDPKADSGHARGLWQFIPSTAEHMGLNVKGMRDDRLNVRKSTAAAAEYLDQLGEMFNYNWGLALAAYNCGPGCVRDAVQRQRTWDFFDLRLRKETAEYVPRFLAMLQVAEQKYGNLMAAEASRADSNGMLSEAEPEAGNADAIIDQAFAHPGIPPADSVQAIDSQLPREGM